MIPYDARNNEFQGSLDQIGGGTYTDTRTASGTLGALNAELLMDIHGKGTAAFEIRTAACSATFSFEATLDGTNYVSVPAQSQATEILSFTVVVTTTHAVTYFVNTAGWRRVRCRISAYVSGSAVVTGRAAVSDKITYARPIPATLAVTATGAAAAGVTLTIPAATGLYHYITSIEITRNATAALAGTATLVITTTNLPGSLAWSVGNAMAAGGTQIDVNKDYTSPIKSSVAGAASTIVMPVPGAAVLWRANVCYYVGA